MPEIEETTRPSQKIVNVSHVLEAKDSLASHGISTEKILKIESDNWHDVYRMVGVEFSDSICESFDDMLKDNSGEEGGSKPDRIKIAKNFAVRLNNISQEESEIGNDVKDAVGALTGWAEGSGLDKLGEKFGLTALEAALILENDNVGCQSFMARTKDGGVVVMHTEEDEDISHRVSKFHLVEMKVGNEMRSSFVYNNLLPGGAALGEGEGFLMATDFLRTNTLGEKEGFNGLANIAAWIVWKNGRVVSPEKIKTILNKVGPFVDGYAMNIARRLEDGKVEAFKVIFAGDGFRQEELSENTGSHLEQTNLIEPKIRDENPELYKFAQEPYSMPETPDKMPKAYLGRYLKRIKRIQQAADRWAHLLDTDLVGESDDSIHETMHRIMSLKTRFNWGFANNNVAATYTAYLGSDRQTTAIGVGPAVKDVKGKDLYIR